MNTKTETKQEIDWSRWNGAKVLCIKNIHPDALKHFDKLPIKGKIYCVKNSHKDTNGTCLHLVGINAKSEEYCGFTDEAFRFVHE